MSASTEPCVQLWPLNSEISNTLSRTLQTEPQTDSPLWGPTTETHNKKPQLRWHYSITAHFHSGLFQQLSRGWISSQSPSATLFLSHTAPSISLSSPRGQCQQEVGLGRRMRQSRLCRVVLHSKNEPASRGEACQNKTQPLLDWLDSKPAKSDRCLQYWAPLHYRGSRVRVTQKGGKWKKEVEKDRVEKGGKNPESLSFLSEKRKGVEASCAQPQPDSWAQCNIQHKVH